jgi:HSP20 family protein
MTTLERTPLIDEMRSPMRWADWFLRRPALWAESPWGAADLLRVEECRSNGDLVVRAEIPGVDPEHDVTVSLDGDVLTIHGERRHRAESHEHEGFRTEFRYGAFTRSITLPQSVDADAIRASYHDGILEVVVPMPAAAEPKATQIPVAHD